MVRLRFFEFLHVSSSSRERIDDSSDLLSFESHTEGEQRDFRSLPFSRFAFCLSVHVAFKFRFPQYQIILSHLVSRGRTPIETSNGRVEAERAVRDVTSHSRLKARNPSSSLQS